MATCCSGSRAARRTSSRTDSPGGSTPATNWCSICTCSPPASPRKCGLPSGCTSPTSRRRDSRWWSNWRTMTALDIPAGARDFTVSDDFQLPMDVDVLAVYPHAHYLGKAAGSLGHAARRLEEMAGPHSRLGPQLAGRLLLPRTAVPAQGFGDPHALPLRQFGGQRAQSQPSAAAGARRQPGHRRDGSSLAAGTAARRGRPAPRAAGSRDAPSPGKEPQRFRGAHEPGRDRALAPESAGGGDASCARRRGSSRIGPRCTTCSAWRWRR